MQAFVAAFYTFLLGNLVLFIYWICFAFSDVIFAPILICFAAIEERSEAQGINKTDVSVSESDDTLKNRKPVSNAFLLRFYFS